MKNALIFGATSSIAAETAKLLAKDGYKLALAARSEQKLNSVRNDIQTFYPTSEIYVYTFEAQNFNEHKNIFEKCLNDIGSLDIVILAHGVLPLQNEIQYNFDKIKELYEINSLSFFSLANLAGEYFEMQKSGTIAVISSVAGDVGRQSNYIYGSTKGAVSLFMQGLRGKLFESKVNVLTIKPGFVDTPMTSHLKKNFLFAKPETVARDIIKAIENKKEVIYSPSFWRFVLLLVRLIPENLFKRLKI